MPSLPATAQSDVADVDSGDDGNEDLEAVDDRDLNTTSLNSEQVEFISLHGAFDDLSGTGQNLPVHMRCAAHTFNFLASVDVDKALGSGPFKTAFRKVMAKAQAL
jgi:hypothetical protein